MRTAAPAAIFALLLSSAPASGQITARMFRHPDVSATHVTFVYAGDVWIAPKLGGTARRLSTPTGEEAFPRFSPDGSRIAYGANYDGNVDIYVTATLGGVPERITHHSSPDRMLDWDPDGRTILYASNMESGNPRVNQLFRVAATGGLPEKLPVPYGEFGAIAPDGRKLAYMRRHVEGWSNWKRYRGGWAPDIWLFDLADSTATNITTHPAEDAHPMWHGQTMYFLSDRGPYQRHNIWAYDVDSGSMRQITRFRDFDITVPAIGPTDIVFPAGGRLFLLDLATENHREIVIDLVTDLAALKPHVEQVGNLIQNAGISPTGRRAVFEARGEVFTVPAEHGVIHNLTQTSGVAERYPTWSPDGKQLAYWSDRSGESELVVRAADGSGRETVLTDLGPGFRYRPQWSPDSRSIAYVDQSQTIYVLDLDDQRSVRVDQGLWMAHGRLHRFRVSWSPDSRWLAYHRGLDTRRNAILLFDTQTETRHQVTAGYHSDFQPVFDPGGRYLYLLTNRTISPAYSATGNTWIYPNATNVAAIALHAGVPSPLVPRNDEETAEDDELSSGVDDVDSEVPEIAIDLDDFERRLVVLPPAPGNYDNLRAVAGKILYRKLPRTGSTDSTSPIIFYDLEAREEQSVLDDADAFQISADGKKLLVAVSGKFAIVDLKPNQRVDTPLRTNDLEMVVDPPAEWAQLFVDAWRFERDYFYDPTMHGVDWEAIRAQYEPLIGDAVMRWDVNFVLGEMLGELDAGHLYRSGGDVATAPLRSVGLLGIDWALENGAYRIKRIIEGAPWDSEIRSPLQQPGIEVHEGDYILAVNSHALDTSKDPWASFQGLAGRTVTLTVNDRPTTEGAHEVVVKTLETSRTCAFSVCTLQSHESRLRSLAWIEEMRARVDEASDGRVGYIYVPDTGIDGQNELVRQFGSQFTKEGLIIDDRFNSGGQIPDRFIELLNRPAVAFWAVRHGKDWQSPRVAHFGPKAMLINGQAGSGGDAFPFFFKKAGLGPLIGTRTWGGLIGINAIPPLIDGGTVTAPNFRMYTTEGEWYREGHGTVPDIEVEDDPAMLARGRDAQLERAIAEVLRLLEERPPVTASRPAYENRSRRVPRSGGRRQ